MIVGPFTYTTVTSGNTATNAVAAVAGLRLMSLVIRESSGTPALATANICHGTSNTTIVAPIVVLASTTLMVSFAPQGLPVSSGIYVERPSGNTTITLHTCVE